jgi:hypothetical protein
MCLLTFALFFFQVSISITFGNCHPIQLISTSIEILFLFVNFSRRKGEDQISWKILEGNPRLSLPTNHPQFLRFPNYKCSQLNLQTSIYLSIESSHPCSFIFPSKLHISCNKMNFENLIDKILIQGLY